jgi:hypothetical protein
MSIATVPRTLPIVSCAGSPRRRGQAHGEQLRDQITAVVERWQASLEERHGIPAAAYLSEFVANSAFLPAIERHTPDLLEEVRGIAEGASQPFETMLAYNFMDEEWQYASERVTELPGCTVACLVPAAGAPVIAQTMDIPSVHDGSQAVIHHKPENGVESVVFTGAGMLALNGANAAGIGVVVNNLSMLPWSRNGLPVMFVIRGILDRTTLDEAITFVESVPHAVGQHYAVGSPEGIAGLEGAANGVVRAGTPGGTYVHANHPIANNAVVGDPSRQYARSRTFERHARAAELIDRAHDQSGIEAVLMDESVPISRSTRGGHMTFGATSITCSSPPVVHVTPGPPHETPWISVGL